MSDDKIELELALNTDKFNAELEKASSRVQLFMERMSHMQAKGFVGENYKSNFPEIFNDSFIKNNQWTSAASMRTFFSKQSTNFLRDLIDAKASLAAAFSEEVKELTNSKGISFDTAKWGKIVDIVGGGTSMNSFLNSVASSTGAYHPPEFNRVGGLVAHSKAVAKAVELLGMERGYSDTEIGDTIMAAFVHDAAKYNDQGGYAANHGELVANMLKARNIDPDIVEAINGHMGEGKGRLGTLLSEADMLVSRPYASAFIDFTSDVHGEEILTIDNIKLDGLRKKAIEMGDLREDGRWTYHVLQEEKAKEKEWKAGKPGRDAAKYLQQEEEKEEKERERVRLERERQDDAIAKRDAERTQRGKEAVWAKHLDEEDWYAATRKEKEAEDKLFDKKHNKKQKELERMFANEDIKKMKELEGSTKASENSWSSMVTSVQKMMLLVGALGVVTVNALNKSNKQVITNTGELNSGLPGITGLTQYEQLVNKTASRAAGLEDGAMTKLAVDIATKYADFKTTGNIDALPAALAGQLETLYTDDSLTAQERLWGSLDTAYNNLSGMSKGARSKQLSVLGSLFGVDGLSMLSYALERGTLPSSFATNALVTPTEAADTASTSFKLSAQLAELSTAIDDAVAGINNSVTVLWGLPWAELKLKFFSFLDDTLQERATKHDVIDMAKALGIATSGGGGVEYWSSDEQDPLRQALLAGKTEEIKYAMSETGTDVNWLSSHMEFDYKGHTYYADKTEESKLRRRGEQEANAFYSKMGFAETAFKGNSYYGEELRAFATKALLAGAEAGGIQKVLLDYVTHLTDNKGLVDGKVTDVVITVNDESGKVSSVTVNGDDMILGRY